MTRWEIWLIDDDGAERALSTTNYVHAAEKYVQWSRLFPEFLVSINRVEAGGVRVLLAI